MHAISILLNLAVTVAGLMNDVIELQFWFLLQVYADEERSSVVGKFYGLRQQAEKDNDEPYMCVSDFIAPKGSGVADYVGAFACSAGHGLEKVVEEYKKAGMLGTLCTAVEPTALSEQSHKSLLEHPGPCSHTNNIEIDRA